MTNYNNMVPPMPQLPQSGGGSYGGTGKKQTQRRKTQEQGQRENIMSMSNKIRCRLNPYTGRFEMMIPSLGYGVCELDLPRSSQVILNVACLEVVGNILSMRYNITKNKIKTTSSHSAYKGQNVYSNIFYIQVDISKYEFYLPNGKYIGWVLTPPDGNYSRDIIVIKNLCTCLANRFGLI